MNVGTGNMLLDFVSHDRQTSANIIKFYSEPDADRTTDSLHIEMNLIDDDRNPSAASRKRHLIARIKEGWMPTDPPLRGGTEYTEGVDRTTLGYASTRVALESGNSLNGTDVDITDNFSRGAAATRPNLTLGQEYFLEVNVQTRDNISGDRLSRGAQRFGIRFTATANVSPS